MLNCAIIGATGYTGAELIKILLRHPNVQLTHLTTRQKEAIPVRKIVPGLPADVDLEIRDWSFTEVKKKADVVFLCLPHTEAMETAQQYYDAKKIVIDLSADFRLKKNADYEKWYATPHRNKALLKHAVYGLTELYREKIKKADLIANPGCYPTGAILGIAPLLKAKAVRTDDIVIDAKSGVSGAGKKLNAATQYCEVDENFYAYKVGRHQHTPEIKQALSDAAGKEVELNFTPHLLPLERGILSTIYLRRNKGVNAKEVSSIYKGAYAQEFFIRLKAEGEQPSLRDVQRTNFCDIGFWADPDSDRLIVITAIDNLIKGASGQAVQNMNVRANFPEEEGLRAW